MGKKMDRKPEMPAPSIKTPQIMDGKPKTTMPSIKTSDFMDENQT